MPYNLISIYRLFVYHHQIDYISHQQLYSEVSLLLEISHTYMYVYTLPYGLHSKMEYFGWMNSIGFKWNDLFSYFLQYKVTFINYKIAIINVTLNENHFQFQFKVRTVEIVKYLCIYCFFCFLHSVMFFFLRKLLHAFR